MNKTKVDFDPTPRKVLLIALLLFIESLLGAIVIQAQEGSFPTPIQWMVIVCVAGLQLVTYLLEFLRSEEETKT